jgi:hypothetical protein
MPRLVPTALIVGIVAAWASAQGPAGPTAADRLKLFDRNRPLLEKLVDAAVLAAGRSKAVDRADACRVAAEHLTRELAEAAAGNDPDRVSEVGEYLSAVLTDGLTPTLDEARRTVPAGSADADALLAVYRQAAADAERAETIIPFTGPVGGSERAAKARRKIADARGKLTAASPQP